MQSKYAPGLADTKANTIERTATDSIYGHNFGSVRISDDLPKAASASSQERSEVHRYVFSAVMPVVEGQPISPVKGSTADRSKASSAPSLRVHDTTLDGEEVLQQQAAGPPITTIPSTSTERIPELEDGQTVQIPDVVMAEELTVGQSDAIVDHLKYEAIFQDGTVNPGEFGTTGFAPSLTDISVTRKDKQFVVTATVDNTIDSKVLDSVGPNSQIDIESQTDPGITAANYPTVVSDLTPNTSDLKGRPPRTGFWARDLTLLHEQFHMTDGGRVSQLGVSAAEAWLAKQTATTVAEVEGLVTQVPSQVQQVVKEKFVPGAEERAYSAGAPKYIARANAIKKRGDAGKYP